MRRHKPTTLSRLLPLAALALLAPLAHAGDVYCMKKNGKYLQCSDFPFEGAVLVRRSGQGQIVGADDQPAAPTPSVASANSSTGAAISDRLRQEQTQRAVKADVAATRAQQCKEATERYDRSIRAMKLYRTGPKGEQIWLTEAELDAARLEARNARDTACAGAR
jgi:hypothetical protein